MEINELRKFLVESNSHGYASNADGEVQESDGSNTIAYELGDWRMHDNFFGGEPFGGREVVFYRGKAVWMMTYYGFVEPTVKDVKKVYQFLKDALKTMPSEKPFRGAESYQSGDFKYQNKIIGEIENFHGEEIILQNGQECYRALYAGGLVDIKA